MPALSEVHIDQALTNVSLMYGNETYIGEQVLPVLPVAKRTDLYFRYKKEAFLTGSGVGASGKPLSLRRPKAKAAELDFDVDTDNYNAEEYALDDLVADEIDGTEDAPLNGEIDAVEFLTERLKIDNETATAALVSTRANYPASNKAALTTGAAGTSWADYAAAGSPSAPGTSNPFAVINSAKIAVKKGIARAANTFLCGGDTAQVLSNHPLMVDRVKYVSKESLTNAGLPMIIQGLAVIEGEAQHNSSPEGVAYAGDYVWKADDQSSMALIYYRNPSPRPRTIAFGWTFEAPNATTGKRGLSVNKWRDEGRSGTMVRVRFTRDWKIVAVDNNGLALGGYLVTNCTA